MQFFALKHNFPNALIIHIWAEIKGHLCQGGCKIVGNGTTPSERDSCRPQIEGLDGVFNQMMNTPTRHLDTPWQVHHLETKQHLRHPLEHGICYHGNMREGECVDVGVARQ